MCLVKNALARLTDYLTRGRMPRPISVELSRLLDSDDSRSRDEAWDTFVRTHSRIIHHAARSTSDGYDDTMDRYTHVLQTLREDDFRRLRRYVSDGRTQFSTWLVIVARRLCIDYHRARYGRRPTDKGDDQHAAASTRRQLVDLVGARIDIESIADGAGRSPELALRSQELGQALIRALTALPAEDRILLKLRFEEGASVREITSMMSFPSQFHVYRRLKSVLGRLKKDLENSGIDGPAP